MCTRESKPFLRVHRNAVLEQNADATLAQWHRVFFVFGYDFVFTGSHLFLMAENFDCSAIDSGCLWP